MHACSAVLHLFSFFLPSLPSPPILYRIFSHSIGLLRIRC
jgi:hypothetical protein